jgi:hypothetical protein
MMFFTFLIKVTDAASITTTFPVGPSFLLPAFDMKKEVAIAWILQL